MKLTFRIILSVGLLSFLAIKVKWSEFFSLISEVRVLPLTISTAILIIIKFYTSYRWLILLRCRHADTNYLNLVKTIFVSNFYGQFLPGGGEDAIRVFGQSKKSGDLAYSFSSVLLDRLFGIITLAATSSLGVHLVESKLDPSIAIWAYSVFILATLFYLASQNDLIRKIIENTLNKFSLIRIREKFDKLIKSLHAMQSNKGAIASALSLSIGLQLLRVLSFYFTAISLGIELSFTHFIAFVPLIYFVLLLPISVGGFGTREAITIYLFSTVNIDYNTSFSLSMLLYFTTALSSIPGAFISHKTFLKPSQSGSLSRH